MIASLRPGAAGAGIALCFALACRDAPSAPQLRESAPPQLSAALATDSAEEIPSAPPEILWGTTTIFFYDGRYGGTPYARFTGDMEYTGNRASMDIKYAIAGDGALRSDNVHDEQNQLYNPTARHRFTRAVDVATNKNCGLDLDANTMHRAWWFLWLPGIPAWESPRPAFQSIAQHLQIDLCPFEPEEEPDGSDNGGDGGGGGGSGGGWIIIETCYYWAHYVNDVLVYIEFRYCEYDQIPVADQ